VNDNIRELEEKLKTADGEEKIELLNELSNKFFYSDIQKARDYGERALTLAQNEGVEKGIAEAFHNIGITYFLQRDYPPALEYYEKSLEIRKKLGNETDIARSYNVIASFYCKRTIYSKGLDYFNKAKKIYETLGDQEGIARILGNMANAHQGLGNYTLGLDYYLNALTIYEELADEISVVKTYQNIAVLYFELHEYDLSLEYSFKALAIYEKFDNRYSLANVLNNIAIVYKNQGKYSDSLEYQQKALKIQKEFNNRAGIAGSVSNIATIYYNLKKYSLSLEYYNKAIAYCKEIGEKDHHVISLIGLVDVYIDMDQADKAIKNGLDALSLAEETGRGYLLKLVYEMLYRTYRHFNDFEKALEYHVLFKQTSDTLLDEEKSKQLTEMQTKYETEKKEREAEIFRLKNVELKNALDELKRTQKQLVESEKMASLGTLVAGVAHEINTPVGIGITASSSLLKKTEKFVEHYNENQISPEDLEDYLQSIYDGNELILTNLKRTANLIQSFKQVSVDQTMEEKRTFNLKSYLDDILISLSPKLKGRNIQIHLDCPENLEIHSYPGVFAQIFTNFITNSLTYAFDNDAAGEIYISLQKTDAELYIEYRDNGNGIAEDILPNIFEPFVTSNAQTGKGLGLHIVYNLVTQSLKGTIHCESQKNEGTLFKIEIPL
jgi:signal transduction histidine kinase